MSQIGIVMNPAARRGHARRVILRVLAEATKGDYFLQATAHPGDERRAVHDALDRGCTTIVAVGGDGTWSKVGAALVEANSECRLAFIAAGTGNDFAKSLGAPASDIAETLRLARDGGVRTIDVLRVGSDYCLNVAGFGFDAQVLASVRPVPFLRGDALYLWSALRELFSYRGIEIDTGDGFRNHLILAVCNGARFGGQFHISPNSSVDDGIMDVIAIHDAAPLQRLGLLSAVMKGVHPARPDVTESRTAEVTLRFRSPPIYEIDGELRRATESEIPISVIPRTLCVVTA